MPGLLLAPDTFETGRAYLRVPRSLNGSHPPPETVTFLSYCACPAFLVVRDRQGVKQRLPREELYEMIAEVIAEIER
jgi:hypothetical protein